MRKKIQFMGATETVTGSRTFLEFGANLEDRILVDCGLYQGLKELRLRNWDEFPVDPASIGSVLITHAHIDHCGYLPRLVKKGFHGPIYCSSATADLMNLSLLDSAHLQEEEANFANKKGFSKHTPALPLYTTDDVMDTLQLIRSQPIHEAFEIGQNIKASFHNSGHILGSNMIKIWPSGQTEEGILFSGDLGRYEAPLLPEADNPSHIKSLTLESTYGDRLHDNRDLESDLADIIIASFKRNGVLLIPAFAIGRTQHLLFLLKKLQTEELIPDIPIFLDSPMAIQVSKIYARHSESLDLEMNQMKSEGYNPFIPANFHTCTTSDESKSLNSLRKPAIIISASGMATGGRILHHLSNRLANAKDTVLFIGYQAQGTRGRLILDGAESIKIFGAYVPIKASIKKLDGLSAHADRDEILVWLEKFPSLPKQIFLNHGEPDSIESLKTLIQSKFGLLPIVPKYLDTFDL